MRARSKSVMFLAAVSAIAAVVLTPPAAASGQSIRPQSASVLLRSDLIGSLASDPVLFDIVPGTNDWSTSRSWVVVHRDGRFQIAVRDLILVNDGANLLPLVSASLICNGSIASHVDPVPFSEAGDASLSGQFTVPARCLAPVVLLNPLERDNVYIAASGQADS